jgi:hypothetical protein
MRGCHRRRLLLVAATLALAGCTSGSLDNASALSSDNSSPDPTNTPGGQAGSGNRPGGNEDPGVETEVESSYQAPVITGKYVWSANPASGRVALIDAETFEVHAVDAGFGSRYITAIERADGVPRALVINTQGHDATLLELEGSGRVHTERVGLHEGADSWSVAPGGRFAIAWSDSRNVTNPDPTDGFQDISVIELGTSAPAATRLSIGYRPVAFAFDSAGTQAFAITADGISVIALETGAVRLSRLVPLPSARNTQPDVSVLADGSRALARLEGSPLLYDIDLASGGITEHDLGGRISDLDVSASGTLAVAVVQRAAGTTAPAQAVDASADAGLLDAGGSDAGTAPDMAGSEAVFIPIPAGLADAAPRRRLTRPNETFGSVALSADGQHAVLFTTSLNTGRVTLVGPELEARAIDLIAAVRAVFVTADGSHALALQTPPAGSVKRGAFSVLSLAAVRSPKLVASDAPALSVALAATGSERALVTVSEPSSGTFGTFLVRMPSLQVDFSELPSLPLAAGMIPAAGKGFVSQQHPEGRITFIDLADGAGREITGFELSSKVVNQ